jgi:hypothetical protein
MNMAAEPTSTQKRDSVGPTDMAPVSRQLYSKKVVKITLSGPHAFIVSKDGAIAERYPSGMLQKRFARGQTVGYFHAIMKANSPALEIEEQVSAEKW